MKGQWIGTYDGTRKGKITVNIDELPDAFDGVAYAYEDTVQFPASAIGFRTPNKAKQIEFRASPVLAIHPFSGEIVRWEAVSDKFPGVVWPTYIDVTVDGSREEELSIKWTSQVGTQGECKLPKSKASHPSELKAQELTWEDYKKYVSTLKNMQLIFRGQNGPYRLRTAFHRAGRFNLFQFLGEDVPALARRLSARARHVFDISKPDEFGALLNLAQHHGYPTPLLDWTYSPYVAAFFAFRSTSREQPPGAKEHEKVRVLIFDQHQWKRDWEQHLNLATPRLHFSIGEFLAIDNERMIPQQAISTVTNIDDIESWILEYSAKAKKEYLRAIDLPAQERCDVIRELGFMGITAGSMFPGFDGTCRDLSDRYFPV